MQISAKSGARTLGFGMLFGSQSKQDLSGFANLTGLCVEGRLTLVVGAFLLLIGLLTWLAARCTDSSAITRPPAGRLATERPIARSRVGPGEALRSVGSEGNETAGPGSIWPAGRRGRVPLWYANLTFRDNRSNI